MKELAEDKIIFGIDNWNVEYGWWTPNTIPADFVVDGVKRVPATHNRQWFTLKTSIHEPSLEEVFASPAAKRDYLYYSGVNYAHVQKLGHNKYIFPVFVHSTMYFRDWENYGLQFVSPKAMNDIKEGRAKLVFIMQHEGTSGGDVPEDPSILSKWLYQAKIDREDVYYISCNYAIDSYAEYLPFQHISINPFVCWIPDTFDNPVPYNPVDQKNLFLTYSRQPRLHRLITTCELLKEDLIKRGIVSFWKPDNIKVSQYFPFGFDHLIPIADELDKISPINLDIDLEVNNPAQNIVLQHYERTFMSLVSETIVSPRSIFFSEKIYKPLATGHPFMLIGGYRQLEKLRSFGYQTFGQWFDESYDQEPDWYKRILMIMSELKRLSSMSDAQLVEIRLQMQSVLKFNQTLFNLYRSKAISRNFEQPLYDAIEKIWKRF